MASKAAIALKRQFKEWAKLPAECFEVLTFGDLAVGQTFIPLPAPVETWEAGDETFTSTGFMGTEAIHTKIVPDPQKDCLTAYSAVYGTENGVTSFVVMRNGHPRTYRVHIDNRHPVICIS